MVLAFNLSNAQTDSLKQDSTFPYDKVNLLIGKTVRVEPIEDVSSRSYGYSGFYTNKDMKYNQSYKEGKGNSIYHTGHDEIAGKEFKVISVTPYTNSLGTHKYKIELLDEDSKTVWFDYSEEYSGSYYFSIKGNLGLSKEFICSKLISKEVDKFDGEITYRMEKGNGLFYFIKITRNNESEYYLSAHAKAVTLGAIGKSGFTVLFENGEKMDFPDAKLDTEVQTSEHIEEPYIVSAFVPITKDQLYLFINNRISMTRHYIFDTDFSKYNPDDILEVADCLYNYSE